MGKITTVLFDFDGVVADTEPLYDGFWYKINEKYQLGIPDFPSRIKGTTLQNIFDTYFTSFSKEEINKIALASAEFEKQMHFPEVSGAVTFICILKEKQYKIGLVTSSASAKIKVALKEMGLEGMFDTMVTADRITHGKPDPMCYLLAAGDLQAHPDECVVFEDAFTGIQAGTAAGMRVIGLSTTNSAEAIREKVYAVIPDFSDPCGILKLMAD